MPPCRERFSNNNAGKSNVQLLQNAGQRLTYAELEFQLQLLTCHVISK